MYKPVLIAPATMVLQPKTITLTTKSVVPARKTVVLVPLPVNNLSANRNLD